MMELYVRKRKLLALLWVTIRIVEKLYMIMMDFPIKVETVAAIYVEA